MSLSSRYINLLAALIYSGLFPLMMDDVGPALCLSLLLFLVSRCVTGSGGIIEPGTTELGSTSTSGSGSTSTTESATTGTAEPGTTSHGCSYFDCQHSSTCHINKHG